MSRRNLGGTTRLGAILFILSASSVQSAGPPTFCWPMTERTRQELDARAKQQPRSRAKDEQRNLVGTIPAFLLTRLYLPAEEELRRAEGVHAVVRKRDVVVPTPERTKRLLQRLVEQIPTAQKLADARYTLTLLEKTPSPVTTPGGGVILLRKDWHDRLLAEGTRGEAALSFLLARELAHQTLGHCRLGWQKVLLEEEALKGIELGLPAGSWRDLLETKVRHIGEVVQFLYSANQEYRADLYAFHLCRNARIPLDEALDGMRWLVTRTSPEAVEGLSRLKRLLQERDGQCEPDDLFGLFAYDRTKGEFVRCRAGAVAATSRPIVFVHGLYGTKESFLSFLRYFGEQKALTDRPLVVFRYPGNGSLACSGQYLWAQVQEVFPAPEKVTFICHSAGGLVFRLYAEKLGGKFDRAVLLATPHQGSQLTQLKYLVDLQEFLGSLRLGLPEGVEQLLAEGRGEIGLDLQPDSLLLRYLGSDRKLAAQYHLLYGECLGPVAAGALQLGFRTAREQLGPRILPGLPEGLLRRQTEKFLASLVVPTEITRGDGFVSVQSARLPGVAKATKLRLGHLAFRSHPQAMRLVLESLLAH